MLKHSSRLSTITLMVCVICAQYMGKFNESIKNQEIFKFYFAFLLAKTKLVRKFQCKKEIFS